MPLSIQEERFGKKLRETVNEMAKQGRAAGHSRKQIKADIRQKLLHDSPEQRALRVYGERSLNLDWQTILKIIVQLLPLLLMFI
jgi:hypothetical protein